VGEGVGACGHLAILEGRQQDFGRQALWRQRRSRRMNPAFSRETHALVSIWPIQVTA
jgi:hypothetical protein